MVQSHCIRRGCYALKTQWPEARNLLRTYSYLAAFREPLTCWNGTAGRSELKRLPGSDIPERRCRLDRDPVEFHVAELQRFDAVQAGEFGHFYNRFLLEAVLKRRPLSIVP